MSLLLSSAALSLLAVAAVWIAGRRDPAQSPLLTLGSLITLLALPLLAFLPKITLEMAALSLPGSSAPSSPAIHLIAMIWAGGMIFSGTRMLADGISLSRFRAESILSNDSGIAEALKDCSTQLDLHQRVGISIHPKASAPFVAGLFQPIIYLPRHCGRWEKETLRMVLLHELGHIARRDLWTNLAARLACVIYWFNPLVWWLRSKLITQCEFACDARVIAAGTNRDNYANALCDVAEASSLPASAMAMPMAGRTPLGARIERVVDCRTKGRPFAIAAALLLTVSASLGLSVIRFSPAHAAMSSPGGAMAGPSERYTPEELFLRSNARAFPAD